jgi:transcriptional regulator with XRE-family HTH domain
MSLSSIDLGLREILADPARRQAFFRAITQDDIADQIRSLRKTRDLTQTELAGLSNMRQSAVSRIEQADYASWTLATLFRIAGALNARWRVILEPCEEAMKEYISIEEEEHVPAQDETRVSALHAFWITPQQHCELPIAAESVSSRQPLPLIAALESASAEGLPR